MEKNDDAKNKKLELEVSVNAEEYWRACLIKERRVGSLRKTPIMMIVVAVLLMIGVYSFMYSGSYNNYILVFIFSVAIFVVVFVVSFYIEPSKIKSDAQRNFDAHSELMYPLKIRFGKDDLKLTTPYLKITDQYAILACCVETPELFLMIKDKERMHIIPKRGLSDEQRNFYSEFFSTTFARKHYKMNSWIF